MLTSLYTGVSGINAHMAQLSVVGNNIANMNTYGFKGSRSYFADVISQSLGGARSGSQIGLGVNMTSVMPNFTQGAFESTANPLDLAIDGNGFFIMKDSSGINFFSRAGMFNLDKDGKVVDQSGMQLQGYMVDSNGDVMNTMGGMTVIDTVYPPKASEEVFVAANLQSNETILAAFDVNTQETTSNFSTTISVFDSLGNSHPVSLCFRKDAEAATGNTWEWFAVIEAADAESGLREISAQGTLDFTDTGALQTSSPVTYPGGGFNFVGGPTQNLQIAFDFGASIDDGEDGLSGLTQFGNPSGVHGLHQDGFESGSLQGVSFDEYGVLTGNFTNGKIRSLGQVALANFQSPQGLSAAGSMLYTESTASGPVIIGKPDSEGMGRIQDNTLELSNVDLAGEFVRMITAQRGFQANSKVITSTDEVLMELVNLKR